MKVVTTRLHCSVVRSWKRMWKLFLQFFSIFFLWGVGMFFRVKIVLPKGSNSAVFFLGLYDSWAPIH